MAHPAVTDFLRALDSFDRSKTRTEIFRIFCEMAYCALAKRASPFPDQRDRLEAAIEGVGGRFSHVTEYGCKLMIVRHLIDAGLIGPAEDNSHLDEINTLIAAETEAARETMTGKPRVGDFVIMPDGRFERCSYAWPQGHGMQTTRGGSFHVTRCGSSSFSGSLNRAQLWEYFKDTGEIRRGKFWFFSHNRAGAGRGVDVFLPCRVYRLEPFAMSEVEARAHPKAVRAAEVWGEDHPDHLTAVRALMEARA